MLRANWFSIRPVIFGIARTRGFISGDLPPAPWNPNPGQGTQDGGVTWTNLGNFHVAKPSTLYATGRGGARSCRKYPTSANWRYLEANPPAWNEDASITTLDASVTWVSNGPMTWQSKSCFVERRRFSIRTAIFSTPLSSTQTATLSLPELRAATGIVQPTWNTLRRPAARPPMAPSPGSA